VITDKEAKHQLLELKRMLLPEMVPDKLNYLNVGKPDGHDDLCRVLKSPTSGTDLISLLQKRIEKVQHFRCNKGENSSIENTELGNLNDNILIICNQLVQLTSVPEFNEASIDILEQVITTAITIGYTAGSHDMKVNLERHGEKGYESSIITPQLAGNKKAEQNSFTIKLVREMSENVSSNPKIGKVSNKILSEAIYDVISLFSKKGNNKNLKAFKNFKNKYPEQRSIEDWIRGFNRIEDLTSTARSPSILRLKDYLQSEFTHKNIREILKK
jgi:hypothetical protein